MNFKDYLNEMLCEAKNKNWYYLEEKLGGVNPTQVPGIMVGLAKHDKTLIFHEMAFDHNTHFVRGYVLDITKEYKYQHEAVYLLLTMKYKASFHMGFGFTEKMQKELISIAKKFKMRTEKMQKELIDISGGHSLSLKGMFSTSLRKMKH